MSETIQFARVGLSLPCMVPVVPGTPRTDAPSEERTETCNVDAWWFVGAAAVCDLHFRELCGIAKIDYESVVADLRTDLMKELGARPDIPNATERKPWTDMHRYPQKPELLPKGHPCKP